MSSQNLELEVADNDKGIGLGIAQIGPNTIQRLSLNSGEFMQILGRRRTVAKCSIDESREERRDVIKIDGIIRNNAGISLDDLVTVKKIESVAAKNIVLSPVTTMPIYESEENYRQYLADVLRGIPMVEYDYVGVPYFAGKLFFQVIEAESWAHDIAYIPTADTNFV